MAIETVPITDRLPLIVGVAGDRDLNDRPADTLAALEDQVRLIIARLERDYLDHDGGAIGRTPVVVLSSLIGRAHRIAAGAATAAGAHLVSPFGASPGSDEGLLKADSQWDHEASVFIARYSHVLIAIQEEHGPETSGGATARLVTFRRKGVPLQDAHSVRACLDGAEIGPVIDVILPKAQGAESSSVLRVPEWGREITDPGEGSRFQQRRRAAAGFVRQVLGRQEKKKREADDSWTSFARLIELTKEFNLDAARLAFATDGGEGRLESIERLFGIDKNGEKPLSREALARAMLLVPRWCRIYAVADTLAARCRKEFRRDWLRMFALAFGAIACFEIFAHVAHLLPHGLAHWLPHAPLHSAGKLIDTLLLLAYGGALWGIYRVYRKSHRDRHQERFLDYRALAEALRIAIFWQLMEIGDDTAGGMVSVADAYPIKQPSELAWVKTCLWTQELLDYAEGRGAPMTKEQQKAAYPYLRQLWIDGQADYFTTTASDLDEGAETYEARSHCFLGISLFIALGLVVMKLVFTDIDHHEWRHDLVIFMIGILPALAAALLGYSEKLAYKAQARQYDRMGGVFRQAQVRLADTSGASDRRIRDLLYQLGSEAMREHADWVAIYRQRPIQPP